MRILLVSVSVFVFSRYQLYSQNIKFDSFTDQELCNIDSVVNNLYTIDEHGFQVFNNRILNVEFSNGFLNVSLIALGYCNSKHYGGVKFGDEELFLIVGHENQKPPKGYTYLKYKLLTENIIEIPDCLCPFKFDFMFKGLKKEPDKIMFQGQIIN